MLPPIPAPTECRPTGGRFQGFVGRDACATIRHIERRQFLDLLVVQSQPLATRAQDVHIGDPAEDRSRKPRGFVEDMLTAVEDEQRSAVAKEFLHAGQYVRRHIRASQ
jgi:hypothetical protein